MINSNSHILYFIVSKKLQYITVLWKTFSKAFDYHDHELFIVTHDFSFQHNGSWNNQKQTKYEWMIHIYSIDGYFIWTGGRISYLDHFFAIFLRDHFHSFQGIHIVTWFRWKYTIIHWNCCWLLVTTWVKLLETFFKLFKDNPIKSYPVKFHLLVVTNKMIMIKVSDVNVGALPSILKDNIRID